MHRQATKLSALQPRGGYSNGCTINWSSRSSSIRTWETNTAISVISGYDSNTLLPCHSTERTRLQTKIIPLIGNGTIEQHPLHSMTCSEPFQSKPSFDPFTDESSPPAPRALCPKMAEFLITESYNQNPYPDYGQWDEDKALLKALNDGGRVAHPSARVNATDDAPILHQPRPISFKDHTDALDMILAHEHLSSIEDIVSETGAYDPNVDAINGTVAEQGSSSFGLYPNEFDGEVSSDGYSSDGLSFTADFFESPSYTSSTETTPDTPPTLLAPSVYDLGHLQDMEALEQGLNAKGLDFPAQDFKPANFKKGLNASDLTKAIQSGNLVDLFLQAPSAPASAYSFTGYPTFDIDTGGTDGFSSLLPFSP